MSSGVGAWLLSTVLTDSVKVGGLTALELVRLGSHPHTGWLGGLSARDEAVVQAALAEVVVRGAPEAYSWALVGPGAGDTDTTVAALLAALRVQLLA